MTKQYEYRCPNCNSTNVHIPTWVNPNTGELHDQIDIGDWCDTCQVGINAVMIEVNAATYTPEQIETMHNWLTENDTILANVDDEIIIHAIDTHYPGGIKQFTLNNF